MNSDILSLLESNAGSFSKGQRRIAQYIVEEYDKAAFMTAARLGKTVGVSESTVVRFAVSLGFDGYPGMQKAMQETVLNRLTSKQRLEVATDRMADRDIVSMVLQSDMDKLRRTDETLDREAFQNAVDFLKTVLADDKMPSKEVHDLAAKAQFGFSTLKKAKNYLHLKSFKQGNIWYYPQYTAAKEELL